MRRRHRLGERAPPILLVQRRQGQQLIVVTGCGRTDAAGVTAGMSVPHARALLPGEPLVEPFEPERERRTLERMAVWTRRFFAPLVSPDPPDGLLLDVTGCERLFGGEEPLVRRLLAAIAARGFGARAAIAPTRGGAWGLARFGPERIAIVGPTELAAAIAPLPVAALRVEPEVAAALEQVAVVRIGDLLALPRRSLVDRFGKALMRPLDRALGRAFEGVDAPTLAEPITVERELAGPVLQPEVITIVVGELVEELAARLRRMESGARRVTLHAWRSDGERLTEELFLARPSREARHIRKLLEPRLERLHLGWGVERIGLRAEPLAPAESSTSAERRLPHPQAALFTGAEPSSDAATTLDIRLAALVDELGERLGPTAVRRIESLATWVPERAYEARPVLSAAGSSPNAETTDAETTWPVADRPSIVYGPPESVEVALLAPDGPVIALTLGDGREGSKRIITSVGPERITARWWLAGSDEPGRRPPRDYWKLQDEAGVWWWVFRQVGAGGSRFFLHGRWA